MWGGALVASELASPGSQDKLSFSAMLQGMQFVSLCNTEAVVVIAWLLKLAVLSNPTLSQ